jgi:hypothetical protein
VNRDKNRSIANGDHHGIEHPDLVFDTARPAVKSNLAHEGESIEKFPKSVRVEGCTSARDSWMNAAAPH